MNLSRTVIFCRLDRMLVGRALLPVPRMRDGGRRLAEEKMASRPTTGFTEAGYRSMGPRGGPRGQLTFHPPT